MAITIPLIALPRIAYLGMSAALPGSGELLLGKTTRGAILMGADIIALSSLLATDKQVDDLTASYKQYASVYAGVPINNNDRYYQHIQQYFSSDEFNRFQEMMARNYFLIYQYAPDQFNEYIAANTYAADEAWQWQSTEHHKHYKQVRASRQKAKMYNNLSLGIMILNRAISVIDVAFISGKTKQQTPLYFSVEGRDGLMLNYRLDF